MRTFGPRARWSASGSSHDCRGMRLAPPAVGGVSMPENRWDPFRETMTLRDAMGRLMGDSFVRLGAGLGIDQPGSMPVDLAETANGYRVEIDLPGIKPEDVNLTVDRDTLTVTAERKESSEQDVNSWLVR